MSIQIECEKCGVKRKVNERLAGRTIRCPGCEMALKIPALAVPKPVVKHPEPVSEPEAAVEATADTADLNKPMEVEPVYIPDPVVDPAATVVLNQDADSGVNGSATPQSGVQSNGQVAAAAGSVASSFGSPSDRGAAVIDRPATPASQKIKTGPVEEERPALPDDEDDDGVPPRQKREDGELDMTPMVDVTFLLLIFFMVTASFSLQKSIQFPRQSSDLPSMSNVEEETEELDPIELEIDESGAFLVLAPEWERETPGKQNLTTALKEAIGDNRDGMKLDIKVHENAKLQMLVDGMDAGTIAGFTQIQVTEVDGFD